MPAGSTCESACEGGGEEKQANSPLFEVEDPAGRTELDLLGGESLLPQPFAVSDSLICASEVPSLIVLSFLSFCHLQYCPMSFPTYHLPLSRSQCDKSII